MPDTFAVNFSKTIKSVKLLNNNSFFVEAINPATDVEQARLVEELMVQKNLYTAACLALQNAAEKLEQFYHEIFAGHKAQIAELSVEIARKILRQKVEDDNYAIEAIIEDALQNAPTRQDLVIYLNPTDLAVCQKMQQENPACAFAGITLAANSSVGRAECVLESPKGLVKSLIDEHLEQIGKTLKQTD